MITASSPTASTFLNSVFGTPTTSVPGLPDTDAPSTTDTSSPAYLLSGSLASSSSSDIDLTNILYAQDTISLLSNPHANGAITGTPSANVQKLLSELDPASTNSSTSTSSSSSTPTSTSSTTTTPTLPTGGILA